MKKSKKENLLDSLEKGKKVDKSIRQELHILFLFMGYCASGVIVIAILFLFMQAFQVRQFYNMTYHSSLYAQEAKTNMYALQTNIFRVAAAESSDETNNYIASAETYSSKLSKNIEQLSKSFLRHKDILDKLNAAIKDETPIRNQILSLAGSHDSELLSVLNNNYLPAVDNIMTQLDEITNLTTTNASRSMHYLVIFFVSGIILFILLIIAFDLLLNRIANKITNEITDPIDKLNSAFNEIVQGNLTVELSYNRENEYGNLFNNVNEMIQELQTYICNISDVLLKLSSKDMTVTVDIDYMGDFKPIKDSLNNITSFLNQTFQDIKQGVTQVTNGAENIAQTGQALAIGATEQTSSVQELVATIHEVSEDVSITASKADNVAELSNSSVCAANEGNKYMETLLNAMEEIKMQSTEISNIIQMIDSISSQTNLLSLNASIEAARAGEHGKGFAVVANEIGKLANESAEAARKTSELISNSLNAVEQGSLVADETAQVLKKVYDSSSETSNVVNDIAIACEKENNYLQSLLQVVKQISDVVESNSASAEESSALGEELLSQTEVLLNMVNEYRLTNI